MKLIIAGSRDISLSVEDLDILIGKYIDITQITEVVSGCAKGIDTCGILWANKHSIPIKKFVPDWTIGKSAGHIRNREMGIYADQAFIIYNGSKGSQGMIDCMVKLKKPCVVIEFE